MTALSLPVPRPEPPHGALSRRSADDTRLIRIAAAAAAVLHLLALGIPVPEAAPVEMPEIQPTPITLTRIDLPLPELPRPPVERPPTDRLTPIPFDERPDLQPAEEPAPELSRMADGPVDVDLLLVEQVQPPTGGTVADPYDELTEGLIPPVPFATRRQPDYPEMARRIRKEGRVVLRAVITAEGEIASIEVLHAPRPDLGFSEAAVEAVSTWRYQPGLLNGRPVPVALTVLIEFSLR